MADEGLFANTTPFGPQADTDSASATAPVTPPDNPFLPPKGPLATSHKELPRTENGGVGIPWYPNEGLEFPGGQPGDDVIGGIKGIVSGDSSVLHPEIPALNMPGLGLGVTDPKAWGIVGNMALSRDPAALERAIQSRIPDAKFTYDESDPQGKPADGANRTVQVPGGPTMYLDRPGFTPQKGLFYGPQTAVALASGGRSLPVQMGLGGVQHALSTLGSYGLGGAAGPFDVLGTALSTLAPGALGALGAGAVKGYEWLNSEVAPPAADVIKRLGTEGLSAADQAAAAIADRARTLYRWGFAGKPGDILNDPVLIAKEDLAANAGPPGARRVMSEFHRTNAETVDVNKRQIIAEASGDTAPGVKVGPDYAPNESYFGDKVNDAVTARVKALTDTERDAWDKIGDLSPSTEAGRSVQFSPDVSADVLGNHARIMNKYFGESQAPGGPWSPLQLGDTGKLVADAFDQTKRVLQPAVDGAPGPIREFNLGQLQDLRQQFGNIIADKPGTAAAAAAAEMKRSLDTAIATAENTPGQLLGDPVKLAQFRAANAATRARYQFTEPENNPAAERLISGITNPAAPATGQETVSTILGGGSPVTPGGGTNPIVVHLRDHLGDEATDPLSGALTLRTLYGNRGTSATADTAPARYDYDSTSSRIGAQLGGKGSDVTRSVLPPATQESLGSLQNALDILGAAGRKAGPRQNQSGTGYIGMMTRELPFGFGPIVDRLQATLAAKNAVQGGAELVNRAVGGANTAADLQVRLPRVSTIRAQDPQNPFFSWQPEAWRAGTPVYRGGGLLGAEALDPANR